MSKIKIMEDGLINKIAAGEVVEKCSSVVKELLENSIDANSKNIKIELLESGTKSIKVIDDGTGMDKNDAQTCFLRHATSKLMNEDDLFRINTLGFRGEALPSIAAVSMVEIKTSTGEIGTVLKIDGGKVVQNINGDSRKGTIIEVSDLFYNTPARLKHLKSLYGELYNIVDYVNKIALSYPNVSFELKNDGKRLLYTDGSGDILKVINAIYGLEVSKSMLYIEGENSDYKVYGYISKPEVTRSNRNSLVTIVNGRVVKNTVLNKIINDSYHTYKPESRYPIVCLNIEVDSSLIDVNIHPSKQDIKFSNFDKLEVLVKDLITNQLKRENLIPKVDYKREEPYKKEEVNDVKEEVEFKQENLFDVVEEETKSFNSEEIIESFKDEDRMPVMYPVGSVFGTYIICQNELGMYLMDQHAAKERINYEKYLKVLGNPNRNQTDLLVPLTLEFANNEYIILKANFENIRDLGIEIEEFGINSVIIKSHPTWLPLGYENEAIKKILEIIILKEAEFNTEKFNEKIAITMSCKLSIKANDSISLEEMESLVNDLRRCENPFTCPHGRPTVIHYSIYELEKMFKRVM